MIIPEDGILDERGIALEQSTQAAEERHHYAGWEYHYQVRIQTREGTTVEVVLSFNQIHEAITEVRIHSPGAIESFKLPIPRGIVATLTSNQPIEFHGNVTQSINFVRI